MKPSDAATATDVSHSPQWRRIGLLICLALTAGTALAWSLEQRLNSFSGILEARKSVITINRATMVQNLSVKIGQAVVPGQTLCQLIDAHLEDRLISKRREVAESEAEIARTRAAAEVEIAWRQRELQSEIFETQLKIAGLAQERLNKQVEQLAWRDRLNAAEEMVIPTAAQQSNPFYSIAMDLNRPDDRRVAAMLREDAAAAATEALATQIALCEQRLKNLEMLEKNLENKIRASSGVDVAEARCSGSKQELHALEIQAEELTIASSQHGVIGNIHYQSGDRATSNSALIEILDDQQPHVTVRIPSQAAARIRVGMKVTLLFPMNEQRSGLVAAMSPHTESVAGQSESYLPVKIEPTGKLWPKLAIGSNVQVRLH